MTEAGRAVDHNALSVGAAEGKEFCHASQHAAIHRRAIQIHYSYNATHRRFLGLLRHDASQLGLRRYRIATYTQLRCGTIAFGQSAPKALERFAAPNLLQRVICYVA